MFIVLLFSCKKQVKDTTIHENSNYKLTTENSPIKPTSENLENFLYNFGELNAENQVIIETNYGIITIELFNDVYLHRANFIYLVKQGYYDNMHFHRVINNFIIQGGKNKSYETTKKRSSIGYYDLPNEILGGYKHTRGMVSAAREWEDNPEKRSSAFEFFIVQSPKGAFHLNGEHTVFGHVIDGMAVVDAIAKVKTGENDWPMTDVIIKKMTLK